MILLYVLAYFATWIAINELVWSHPRCTGRGYFFTKDLFVGVLIHRNEDGSVYFISSPVPFLAAGLLWTPPPMLGDEA